MTRCTITQLPSPFTEPSITSPRATAATSFLLERQLFPLTLKVPAPLPPAAREFQLRSLPLMKIPLRKHLRPISSEANCKERRRPSALYTMRSPCSVLSFRRMCNKRRFTQQTQKQELEINEINGRLIATTNSKREIIRTFEVIGRADADG